MFLIHCVADFRWLPKFKLHHEEESTLITFDWFIFQIWIGSRDIANFFVDSVNVGYKTIAQKN